jgi:murein L,D-transpeptidase YcbB/YkuD
MSLPFRLSKFCLLSAGALVAALLPSIVAAEEIAPPASTTQVQTPTTTAVVETPPPPPAPLTGAAAAICAKLTTAAPFDTVDRAAAVAFYQGRQCRPLWVDEQGRTHAADLAIAELGRASEWGLDASHFKLDAAMQSRAAGAWSPEDLALADLDITAAVLRYAHEAEGSRIPEPEKQLSYYLDRMPLITGAAEVLAQIADKPTPDEVLLAFQPRQPQFLKLKALLASLRDAQTNKANIPTIPPRGKMLATGVTSPDVAILKKRFAIASGPDDEQLFDAKLETAVKAFQNSNGLSDDGIVGPATRAALAGNDTGSTSDKIEAVIANMEEWRWMPRSLGDTHILVNVPSFSIMLTDDGKTVFSDRVVVGTADKETPIFSKNMTSIVLRPRWNIPDSIKLSMLLSGRSIERQGYVVMKNGRTIDSNKVNWAKANLSAYTFYQPAGDDNALGLVKLLFPNKHSVYLHDTPSKSLFNESVRLYSHGCMRVRNPQVLAQAIFDIDRGDDAPNVKQLIRNGPRDNEIALKNPLPVHVGYFTVWVDDDGAPHYYNDWYGHQKRITLALEGKWNNIDVATSPPLDTSALKKVRFTRAGDDPDAKLELTDNGRYRKSDGGVGDIIRQVLGF